MPEFERNPIETDSRTEHPLTQGSALKVGGFSGGMLGGISYGVTRFLSDADLANSVGIGVGVGVGSAMSGLMGAIAADKEADKLAIEGRVGRATLKGIQGALEAEAGLMTSGAVSGYEIGGVKGAIIGGTIGVVMGLGMPLAIIPGKRETGRAYREVIHPSLDPQNFPQCNVIKDLLFDEKDPILEHPPVYMTPSFKDMVDFRNAQEEFVKRQAVNMKRGYKNPELVWAKMRRAIFVITDVSHYPALDPKFDPVLFGKLKEKSTTMTLRDEELQDVSVKPFRESTNTLWPYVSEFENAEGQLRKFNEKRWNYWREKNWKQTVVVLDTRAINLGVQKPNEVQEDPDHDYQLLDIIVGGNKAERLKKKDPARERLKRLIPEKDTQGI